MTGKKKAITLSIIFSAIGIVFLLFYMDVRETQRDMEILQMGIDSDPKELMMNGTMSIQDYCDHFYSDDPTFCNAWEK